MNDANSAEFWCARPRQVLHRRLHIQSDAGKKPRGISVQKDMGRVEGTHVDHAFDAGHALLDRSGDGALDGEGVGSGVIGGDHRFDGGDLGDLGHGQPGKDHEAQEDDEDGHHHRDHRPADEEG